MFIVIAPASGTVTTSTSAMADIHFSVFMSFLLFL